MVTVTGQLTDPIGNNIPNAQIRFTAQKSTGNTPKTSEGMFTTDATGNYNFNLEEGTYLLECNVTDYFAITGVVIVDSGTPNPLDLIALTKYSTSVDTPTIIPEDPSWITLHSAARAEEQRSKVDQLSHTTNYVNDTKHLWGSSMAEANVMHNVGATARVNQINVYEDPNLNQSIQETHLGSTKNASLVNSNELYDASNGNVLFDSIYEFTGPNGSYTDNTSFTNELSLSERKTLYGSNGHTESIAADDVTINSSEITSLAEGQYTIERKEDVSLELEYRNDSNALVNKPKLAFDNFSELNANIHYGKLYEKGHLLLDVNDEIQSTYERGITIYSRNLYERHTNNGFSTSIEKNPDTYNIIDADGDSVFEVDTVNKEVTLNAKLVVTNPEDFKGEDGDTIFEVFQYSADNGVTDPWHDTFIPNVDKWRRFAISTNGVIGPWSIGINLFAEDGADGDTIYIAYQYNTVSAADDPGWHDIFVDGDIWRRERTIKNGSPISGWSSAGRIIGSDGADGEITAIAYEYSIDGLSIWHSNFSTGDHWRRERVEYFYTVQDKLDGIPYFTTPWSAAAQIVPINGVDYGYKNATITLYQKVNSSLTAPAGPTGEIDYNFISLAITEKDAGAFNGWSPSVPSGQDSLWVAVASVYSLSDNDVVAANEWVIELLAAVGTDGATGTYTSYIFINSSSTPPNTLFASGSYDGVSEVYPQISDGVFYTDDPTPTNPGETTYVRIGKYLHTPATEQAPESWDIDTSVHTSGWSPAVQFSGNDGLDGNYPSFVYRNSVNQPPDIDTDPAVINKGSYDGTSEIEPDLWTDNNVSPVAPEVTWVSKATYYKEDGVVQWQRANGWSTPVKWTGDHAWNTKTVFLYYVGASAIAVPNNPITYTFATGSLSGSLDGWSETIPENVVAGGKIWVTFNTALSQGATDILDVNNWATPEVFSQNGLDGEDGIDGEQGDHGSGSYIIFTSADEATTRGFNHTNNFVAVAGRSPQNRDILSYINETAAESLRFRLDFLYDGSSWTEFANVINGNQIVHGTIAAVHIATGSITADNIAAGTITADKIDSDITFGEDATFKGNVTLIGSSHMRISSATSFGSSNQFIEWFGLKNVDSNGSPITNSLTEANAITYLKANGDAYFGGSLSAGTLKNSATNTQLTPYGVNSHAVEIGPFGTNGNPKNIIISWVLEAYAETPGTCPTSATQPSLTWTLERSITSGVWQVVTNGSFTGSATTEQEVGICVSEEFASGSTTYTDSTSSTANFSYRVLITSYSRYHGTSDVNTQKFTILCTEE